MSKPGKHAGASSSFDGFAKSVFSKDTVKWSKKTASRLGGAIKTAATSAHAAATNAQSAAAQAAALHRQNSQLKASSTIPGHAPGTAPAWACPKAPQDLCTLTFNPKARCLRLGRRLPQRMGRALLNPDLYHSRGTSRCLLSRKASPLLATLTGPLARFLPQMSISIHNPGRRAVATTQAALSQSLELVQEQQSNQYRLLRLKQLRLLP
ncbi:hypothetical protein N658DRAFT_510286 [Parathielavia hyrcaniae]|uniref:Uncharacterized protein n=1 Tax=Parathielavia hyrcaniae TaxID=113614 RepID=A0AAN6PTQ4_9PEZI|nr:hypothetical protein N658DRAFT_510286 [Parathielavia hyrcaniae]